MNSNSLNADTLGGQISNPYEPTSLEGRLIPRDHHARSRPRPGRWHAGLWALMIVLFSFRAVQWVHEWETTRGRVAPTNRLVWNAISIHSGPLAGVYYWDYGHNMPNLLDKTASLLTSEHSRSHRFLVGLVVPLFLLLVLPSTGFLLPPLRMHWHVLIGVLFVLGTCLWYLSAMISVAMLS